MRLRFAGMTDVGRSRENNEDTFFISQDEPLCFVADGMGGHSSGELASAYAVHTIREFYDRSRANLSTDAPDWPFKRRTPGHEEEKRLVQAVLLANEVVHRESTTHPEREGMGTTLVGGYFLGVGLYLIHIGDSRGYRFRDGTLSRVTRDHSLADEYLRMGLLQEHEMHAFPYRNVITRAIGLRPAVEPEVRFVDQASGDLFLFCSDGLTDPLDDIEIEAVLREYSEKPDDACRALIDAANAAGGPDNITVILARIEEG